MLTVVEAADNNDAEAIDCGASSSELLSTTSDEPTTPSNSIESPPLQQTIRMSPVSSHDYMMDDDDEDSKPDHDKEDINKNNNSIVNGNGEHVAVPASITGGGYSRRIYTSARFTSFAEFDEAFDEWKRHCYHPFRVARLRQK